MVQISNAYKKERNKNIYSTEKEKQRITLRSILKPYFHQNNFGKWIKEEEI